MIGSPARVVQKILTETGAPFIATGGTLAWQLFVASMPDGQPGVPDDIGAVYDTDGVELFRFLASKRPVGFFGIQLKIRCLDYYAGNIKIGLAAQYLDMISKKVVTIDAVTYKVDSLIRTSPPSCIGHDDRKRYLFVVNYHYSPLE